MKICTATINRNSPRFEEWMRVFGTAEIPIESPVVCHASAPGQPNANFYRLSVRALTDEQQLRLIDHLALRFNEDRATVARDIDGEHGVPILADDVIVSMDARAFL